jgi:hypothetical protein
MTRPHKYGQYVYLPGRRYPVLEREFTFRVVAGARVDDVAEALVILVKAHGVPITVLFNDTPMYVRPGMSADAIASNWDRRRRTKSA